MNGKSQRIYALAKEAGLIEFETLSWNPDVQSPNPESVVKARKFAENLLIDVIGELYREYPESDKMEKLVQKLCYRYGMVKNNE